ncbi:MAG TPA: hypothetical protein VNJ04_02215 [Gemmatimonadaceae bacterium]|nr:hypothetical protein [Gemmatimonadaceae bacterium]
MIAINHCSKPLNIPNQMTPPTFVRRTSHFVLTLMIAATAEIGAQTDARIGLTPGWTDAGESALNLELIAHRARPQGWFNPAQQDDFAFANADLAFSGNLVFLGGYNGFQVWDVSTPANPTLRATWVCPGGQGDVSVYRNLLFMSVEERRGRIDCGTQGVEDSVSSVDRFRGVRIFDVTNLDQPRQVGFVQTCRGSHTHTLITDPKDPANIYIYVSGTGGVRVAAELAGCSDKAPADDPNTSLFRIEVIRVPLAAPQNAQIVSTPRIFSDSAGAIAGLWKGGSHGPGTQATSETSRCHDITAYPEIGLAAGACSGNGILLDIRDITNPKRIAEVSDPNFAFWHSATFSNDGKKVLFSDEWGGGGAARCLATDRPQWGADAIYTWSGRKLEAASFYKLPAPQTALENCVAHNGSMIPVPGRDIMVQSWYQGGISVFDFTDARHPVEIAHFDRGPIDAKELITAGYWSSYWYNGYIYGSEIARGLDVFRLKPSEFLSENELAAANLVRLESFNAQNQPKFVWPANFVVARAYMDQLRRNQGLPRNRLAAATRDLDVAEKLSVTRRRVALRSLASRLEREAGTAPDAPRVRMLAGAVRDIAGKAR